MHKKERTVRPLTAASLERSAMFLLGRRALTRAQLRMLLDRKVRRVARVLGPEPQATEWIEALLARVCASGLVDDAKVTHARIVTGRAAGRSKRALGAKLAQQGVDRELVSTTLARVDDDNGDEDPELEAAVVWGRKKGLVRKDPQKALASLARQGFSFGIAKRALTRLVADDAPR